MSSLKLACMTSCCFILTACWGSSSDYTSVPPEEPPITGDVIRFNHIGLNDVAVESMFHANGSTWVAGNQGIFVSHNAAAKTAEDAAWLHQLNDVHVTNITGFNANELYAVASEPSNDKALLYRTTNGGESWQRIEHDFGGTDDVDSSRLQVLYADSETGYLYGAGQQALAISYDQGQQWSLLHGDWGIVSSTSTLQLHPEYDHAWLGGQNAIEQSTLLRYQLTGEESTLWEGLLPAPSVNKAIHFDRSNPQRVLIGAEGGILLSENYGEQWSVALADEDYGFYLDVLQSHMDDRVYYSGRWQKGLQQHPLRFSYSIDGGQNWQHSQHPDTDRHYGVTAMALLEAQQNQDVIWVGMSNGAWQGGGVMRIDIDLDLFH